MGRRRAVSQQVKNPGRNTPLLLLIDGHALVFRSWYAIQQPLTVRSTGEEVKGVFGFTNTFLRALRDWNPTHCAIAFDHPAPSFRHLRYDQYKAQRPAAPPAFPQQIAHTRRLMEAFSVPIYEVAGYEADDVLGTLARQAEALGLEVVILTGDTDMLQLVTSKIRVDLHYRIQDSKVYDEAATSERLGGLPPSKQPELKALYGDASDNIPGVPGIGDKTAIKLIQEHGSLEGLYHDIDLLTPRLRAQLQEQREQVFLSQVLAKIVVDMPVTLDMEACRFWQYDRQKVVDFLRGLEFFSIVNRVPETSNPVGQGGFATVAAASPSPAVSSTLVTTSEALDALVQEIGASHGFALAVQVAGRDPTQGQVVGIAFATASRRAWYVPTGHRQGQQLSLPEVLAKLRGLLENPGLPKVAHNAAYDLTALLRHGIEVQSLASDTMVAAHLANRKALGLSSLALDVLGEELAPLSNLVGTGAKQRPLTDVTAEELAPYAIADADLIFRLLSPLEEETFEKGGRGVYERAQLPLAPVLARMQLNGISLDARVLREMSVELTEQLAGLERAIFDDVGHEFNVNSPQQLSHILFEELRLTKTKRTRTGAYTTDAAALEALRDSGEVAPEHGRVLGNLLDYRQLAKLKSTYVDTLPALVNPETGRLHTTYNPAGSATGRLASSDPNLMNIPVRTELGRRIRRAFVAEGHPKWLLLAADYSQIELRVLAHLSGDPALIGAFHRGEDIHAATGSQMFGVPLESVTPDMRRVAKVLNFGVIYGLSAFGVSQQMHFSFEEGARFIEGYFERYPGVRQYVEDTKEKTRRQGYVETLLGRRRYLPEIASANPNLRQAAERMAINAPVQGTAAEVIQLAMVDIYRWMVEHEVRSKMLLQVHDELIFEVPVEEMEAMKAMVVKLMPGAMALVVALKVDLKQGETWGDME
ncbi:MAG: DNA polymerase I [Dehalococcoidia bacterium]|nr:DNA polymerase I [Dehalococcoidia bacterium]